MALQHYFHRDLNHNENADAVDLSISKGQLQSGGPFAVTLYPVFFAHGVVVTGKDRELGPLDLPTAYDREFFEVRGRISFHGRNCTVLRTMPLPYKQPLFDELWIDPTQKSSIQRWVVFAGSNPSNRIDVDWKRTDFGWWPEQWTLTWTVNGKVQGINRLRIDLFEPNRTVADADFKLDAKPGMKVEVADSPPPGRGMNPYFVPTRTYLVSPSGSWEEISAKGYTTLEGRLLPPERDRAWVWWAIGIATAMASTVCCCYYVLRGKRRLGAH
jgi:hypothetical protein